MAKRVRTPSPPYKGEDVEDEDSVEEAEVEEEESAAEDSDEEVEPQSNGSASTAAKKIRSSSATLPDMKLLECPICFECLKSPVFQCDNGHIACSDCCTKVKNKCPFCEQSIGYIRCRAIENILVSAIISCKHSKFGCREKVNYSNADDHESKCLYTPCSCPISKDCEFRDSFKKLSKHLLTDHSLPAKTFQSCSVLPISIGKKDKFLLLEEVTGASLFILNNTIRRGMGNAIYVTCVGPSSLTRRFSYALIAKSKGTTIRLKYVSKNGWSSQSTGFLIVPTDFFGSSRLLKFDLCIPATCISPAGT